MKFLKIFLLFNLVFSFSAVTYAELQTDVKKATEKAVPIAVVPLGWQNTTTKAPVDIATIVSADLGRSSYFKALPEQQMLTKPTSVAEVQFRAWQILGQEYVVVGKVDNVNDDYTIRFQLLGVSKKEPIMDYKITASEQGLRRAAHQISDLIYEKLTSQKAVFGTKVVFVNNQRDADNIPVYKLQIADLDGFDAQTIVTSSKPIMSPAVSPDGTKIAYVSFESQRPVIFVQTLATGSRSQVAAFSGINGAPAWSPDGNKLAVTLSKDGNANIYIIDLASSALTQLTKSSGINTEAVWSPDGQTIVFTSNQNGKPQLYKIPSSGGEIQQLTFEGEYNAKASFSADGQKIAMVRGTKGGYKIAVMELSTGISNELTSGNSDESPSFSSNGAMLLYATHKGNKEVLAAVSVDGKIHLKLDFQNTQLNNPGWVP